jgi:hypothetical protein
MRGTQLQMWNMATSHECRLTAAAVPSLVVMDTNAVENVTVGYRCV